MRAVFASKIVLAIPVFRQNSNRLVRSKSGPRNRYMDAVDVGSGETGGLSAIASISGFKRIDEAFCDQSHQSHAAGRAFRSRWEIFTTENILLLPFLGLDAKN